MSSVHGDRRLSPVRVMIAIVVVLALGVGGFLGYQSWASAQSATSQQPWFAGYVDVTATPVFPFETPATAKGKHIVLSFVVADHDDDCSPTWGAAYSLDEASAALDLDRRLARLEQQGGGIAVSFGGLINDELSTVCTDPAKLTAAYAAVVDRYNVTTIDLDIEGDDLENVQAGERRAAAIKAVQDDRRAAGSNLAVWLTLPVATSGLTDAGTTFVRQMLEAGVDVAGVNAMTMNFGSSLDKGESLADAAERALEATHRQLGVLYELADVPLSDATVWSKLGATPMLGQNDVKTEVFSVADAKQLNAYALDHGLGRMSVWSLNRDVTCGPNYVDLRRVSDACSGIDQGDARFADVLGAGFTGSATLSAGRLTTSEPVDPADITDDPAKSPYSIWAQDSSYLKGAKVVWHRNVYEAKWWTRGDLPDDPVLNEWETPWTLIGPVLAGEKPHQLTTLSYGIYPEWVGTAIYEKATRIVFDGVPYEAKWWNQGESPEAYSSNPDSSPWVPLTQQEIEEAERQANEIPVRP
jgi:chitinase